MRPTYIEMEKLSVVAIPGVSGSGKSSTTRFIIAQLLLDDSRVLLGDPHGNISNESLAAAFEPLEQYFDKPIAKSKDEILELFRYIAKLFKKRLDGARADERYVLILDETPQFFMQCTKEEMQEISKLLVSLANEARKVNIRIFLLGQNWSRDFIGKAAIRSSINTILFHRIPAKEIKLFIENASADLTRKVSNLKQGHVYIYGLGIDPTEVTVPYVSLDDIKGIEKDLRAKSVQHRSATLQSQNAHFQDDIENEEIMQESIARTKLHAHVDNKIKEIMKGIKSGERKEDTIIRVFDTYKSSRNKVWVSASKLYDRIKERM